MQKKIPALVAILIVLFVAAIALFAIIHFTGLKEEMALLEVGRYSVK